MAKMVPCQNCGDDRPGKLRVTCDTCEAVTCIWCSEGHAIGVHATGKTTNWRDSDYWKQVTF